MEFWKRSHTCGELRGGDTGSEVTLSGWVRRRRDHGGVIFVDLADREGITQVVFNPQTAADAHARAEGLRSEYVIAVRGRVGKRPEGTENPDLPTGEIEVAVSGLQILNPSLPPPFPLDEEEAVQEETRLAHRYLDLRRPRMLRNLKFRHLVTQKVRSYLSAQGFWEVETPLLTKSTPEGARDYLVPSRVHPGQFYALPQSPQLFKQMLMVAGVDKYFQIARCLRDEDLRADRQPEHTQVDCEMSFVTPEDICRTIEGLVFEVFSEIIGRRVSTPFPRLTYAEAMLRYGSDKPDLRFGMEIRDLTDLFRETGFNVIQSALAEGGVVRALAVPGGAELSLKQMDELTAFVKEAGAGGLLWILPRPDGSLKSPMKKFLSDPLLEKMREMLGCGPHDPVMMIAARANVAAEALGRLRLRLARDLGLIPEGEFRFLWIVDFPLLEYDPEAGRYAAVHHPFTSPVPEDIPLLDTDPARARALAYDLVLNGTEMGGGSIRIHRQEVQSKMFSLLNISPEEARERFGFLLDALQYGAPPHGGIALGLDRMLMLMLGLDSIRDVITFPKTQRAICLTTGSPSPVSSEQLKELHIRLEAEDEEGGGR
ncbi:MAG TPA: aspartate--tRNA ligase [bacterium]|nr:aspartate--tRNA ligase [bacterium]HPQ66498.1 aspartate--tRNA ligase [bacterium]